MLARVSLFWRIVFIRRELAESLQERLLHFIAWKTWASRTPKWGSFFATKTGDTARGLPSSALVASFEWSNLTKRLALRTPKNGGHFSCRKPVPHLRTSTVILHLAKSCSCATFVAIKTFCYLPSLHLAHVQHLWQSKLFVIFLVLARWRIRLCSELQLARQWLHMHFVIHVCWKKIAMQMIFSSKHFCKFCTMFWTPKRELKNGPKNGARIWPPKWGPKMAL